MIILVLILFNQIPYISSEFKILVFNSQQYRAGQFAFDSNGNMIIEYSKDKYRLLYGLKKDGKNYFGEETPTKEIQIDNNGTIGYRYESRNIFVTINNDTTKQYLLSIGASSSVAELHDLEEGQYKCKLASELLGDMIFSYAFSLLEIDNSNQKEYLIIYLSTDKDYIIKKLSFNDFSLSPSIAKDNDPYDINFANRLVCSCVLDNLIAVFYINYNKYYAINLYNFDLDWLNKNNEIIIDQIIDFPEGYGIFSKCYHLKERKIILIYFKSQSSNSLKLKIGNISLDYTFTDLLTKELNENNFKTLPLFSDFIKIDEERFIFVGVSSNSSQLLSILLIDLFNDYNNMKIRSYESNLNNLYEVYPELSANIFNNLFVFTSTVVSPGSSDEFSIFMMFGYANGTDETIDLSEYFMDDHIYINNNKNIVAELTKNIIIENNIFGYEVKEQLKLVSIPEEILFYNKNNDGAETLLSSNDTLNKDYTLKQNISKEKSYEYYSLDYQIIIKEKDYDDFNSIALTIVDYPAYGSSSYVDQRAFFQPKEYFGRTSTLKFKLCHDFCSTCNKFGISNDSQQCMSCLEDYQFDYFNEYPSNCIPEGYFNDKEEGKLIKCSETNSKFYFDEIKNKTICFKNTYPCPENYTYYNSSSKECQKSLVEEEEENNYEKEIKQTYEKLLEEILNGEYKNKSVIIYKNISTFQISQLEEQNLYENSNISTIDFGECGKKLKENGNDSLILFKIDIRNENLSSLFVQYEIFDANTLLKIDLKICENTSIFINIPSNLDSDTESLYDDLNKSGYNLFNSSDDFYNDICSTYKSQNGTDVILSDRRNSFFKNISFCQKGCEFVSYNVTTKKALCDCQIEMNPSITTDLDQIDFNKTKLFGSFYSSVTFHNFRVALCYKLTFSLKGQIYNLGSYIIIAFMFIFIIMMIIYCSKDYKKIDEYILLIIKIKNQVINKSKNSISKPKSKNKSKGNKKNKENLVGKNKGKKNGNIHCIKKDKDITYKNGSRHRRRSKNIYNNKKKDKKLDNKNNNDNNLNIRKISIGKKKGHNKNKKKINIISLRKSGSYSNSNYFINSRTQTNVGNEYNFNFNLITSGSKEKPNENQTSNKNNLQNKNTNILREDELNVLEYKQALKLDKRNFFQYYFSLIKLRNPIVFTFFHYNDYNLTTIKIAFFFMNFALYFVTNAFFFNDKSMNKIFLDNGRYDFVFQIAQTIYASLVSVLITTVMNRLSLSDSSLLNFKKEKKKKINENELRKSINNKFCFFFILGFVLFCGYWYYISCFCAVYKNTQIIFIKNIFVSYGLSMIYPFGIFLIPTILRIHSLKSKKKNEELYYKLSLVLALL